MIVPLQIIQSSSSQEYMVESPTSLLLLESIITLHIFLHSFLLILLTNYSQYNQNISGHLSILIKAFEMKSSLSMVIGACMSRYTDGANKLKYSFGWSKQSKVTHCKLHTSQEWCALQISTIDNKCHNIYNAKYIMLISKSDQWVDKYSDQFWFNILQTH